MARSPSSSSIGKRGVAGHEKLDVLQQLRSTAMRTGGSSSNAGGGGGKSASRRSLSLKRNLSHHLDQASAFSYLQHIISVVALHWPTTSLWSVLFPVGFLVTSSWRCWRLCMALKVPKHVDCGSDDRTGCSNVISVLISVRVSVHRALRQCLCRRGYLRRCRLSPCRVRIMAARHSLQPASETGQICCAIRCAPLM